MKTQNQIAIDKNQRATGKATTVDLLRQNIPIILILLLATALRLYQLGTESLWIDEFFSIRDAKSLNLNFRVLYFALLRVWMLFGTSDAWLRSLSVIFGIGCVFLIYQLGYRLVGKSTGLISALVIALSPLFIHHSQSVRMYMLSTFLSMAGTLVLLRSFEQPTVSSMRWWAGTRLLAIYTVPLNVLLLLPDVILIWLRFRNQRSVLFAFGRGLLLIGLLWLPVTFKLAIATNDYMYGGWASAKSGPGFVEMVAQLPAFTVYWPLRKVPQNQFWFYGMYGLILAVLPAILLFNGKRSARLLWTAAWALLPSAVILFVSITSSSLWTSRYLLFISPYLIVLLVASFVKIWHWQRAVAIVVTLVYIVAISGGLVRYYTVLDNADWRGAVQMISNKEKPGDAIVISEESIGIVFDHSYHGSAPVYAMETIPGNVKMSKSIVKQALESLPEIQSRLWLTYFRAAGRGGDKRHEVFRSTIEEEFQVQEDHMYSGKMEIFLLTPRSASR
ncbi:MAG: hypothetical protein F6K58_09500 [Symploca sp. SIO2E9]|nr:hypothetical protein [Symploca sp. SIO2E9]